MNVLFYSYKRRNYDKMEAINTLKDKGIGAGIVVARGISIKPASATLKSELDALVALRQSEEFPPQSLKDAVRGMLKKGGFKPSGRNKPASEYLAQAAREGRFPSINNLVDVNNLVSLRSGLPISLLDLDAIGNKLLLRFGKENERYVFNAGGQEIELEGLICTCSGERDEPLGNPVKDSLAGKLKDSTRNVVGVIYAPAESAEQIKQLPQYAEELATWLATEGGIESTDSFVI